MRGYFPCPEEGKNKLWIRSGSNTHSVMFCALRVTGRMKYFCYRFLARKAVETFSTLLKAPHSSAIGFGGTNIDLN